MSVKSADLCTEVWSDCLFLFLVDQSLARVEGGHQAGDAVHHCLVRRLDHHPDPLHHVGHHCLVCYIEARGKVILAKLSMILMDLFFW